MKTCTECHQPKNESEFYTNGPLRGGTHWRCKECDKSYSRTPARKLYHSRRNATIEHKLYMTQYRKENKERFRTTPSYKYSQYKKAAARCKRAFVLSMDQFVGFWQKPCHYCSDPIDSIGLDRMDNSIGYVPGNVVSCCATCNLGKRAMGHDEYISHCRKVANNININGGE